MATTITDDRMTSDLTSHHAFRWTEGGVTGWAVTYLPGIWDRNQAITATTIVETYTLELRGQLDRDMTPFMRDWAAELGLTLDEVRAALDATGA